jgi:hypothetical protein
MTIKLPIFQKMYEYETNYHLTMNEERLSKFLCHFELFKIASKVAGDIVECGVFKGTSLVRFALMRNLLTSQKSSRIIGFDVFSDTYPSTRFKEDKKERSKWIKNAGSSSISKSQLKLIFKKLKIKNYEFIEGDVLKTVPKYIKKRPEIRISMLNIDIDFNESTYCCLKYLYSKVSIGGVILLDNYGHTNGDTDSVDRFFKEINTKVKIEKFPFLNRPCFIIKK